MGREAGSRVEGIRLEQWTIPCAQSKGVSLGQRMHKNIDDEQDQNRKSYIQRILRLQRIKNQRNYRVRKELQKD